MGSCYDNANTSVNIVRSFSFSAGIYCGPLRLLAWEVAKQLNKAKVPCDLITGQERDKADGAKHKVVKVEMADVTSNYHCVIVDEIQASWFYYVDSRDLLPTIFQKDFTDQLVLFKLRLSCLVEMHNYIASVPLIQEILKVTGDHVEKEIETVGKHLCSVVYGSLPPETRTRQATMFKDVSSEFDVLVASDVIGMGFNLNISRIIYSTMMKFDGFGMRELTVTKDVRIVFTAGRAGRYGSKFPTGEVTCLNAYGLSLLHSSLESPSPTLEEHFLENAKLSTNYFIADCEEVLFAQNYAQRGIVRLQEIFMPWSLKVPKNGSYSRSLNPFTSSSVGAKIEGFGSLYLVEFPVGGIIPRPQACIHTEVHLQHLGWQKRRTKRLVSRTPSTSLLSRKAIPNL
ncbi:hypothetical protein C1H46_017459 [Malus baccata]|uniref:Helicase C-terminal domain-containing protein n=1 Tax=Malus baccata TaxID=106549 RepID=A0A540MDT8_MALBA|nr:hypothetical protein C1H46_017459 [Malus baccata]